MNSVDSVTRKLLGMAIGCREYNSYLKDVFVDPISFWARLHIDTPATTNEIVTSLKKYIKDLVIATHKLKYSNDQMILVRNNIVHA